MPPVGSGPRPSSRGLNKILAHQYAKSSTTLLNPQPYWATTDNTTARLYLGDVVDQLKLLPPKSVHCVITSPPYWALRDYGVVGQIGSEKTPQLFVTKMVEVFAAVRRVLRDDGTLWLNLGDTYGGGTAGGGVFENGRAYGVGSTTGGKERWADGHDYQVESATNLKSGNLVGIPWRVALALQESGWVLRQDIIWHKPSPMPESVTNRCTKAREYVFLMVKSSKYYYDAIAIQEVAAGGVQERTRNNGERWDETKAAGGEQIAGCPTGLKNKRSVWTIASQPYPGAHFATFPPNLIEPMILAGTSTHGCCARCGTPWKRVLEKEKLTRSRPNDYVKRTGVEGTGNSVSNSVAGVSTTTIGWEPECRCGEECDVVPCTVLDPFLGSGTTVAVALSHGRRGVGIELNEQYLKANAIPRVEGQLLAKPNTAHLVPRQQRKPVGPPSKKK